MEWFCNSPYVLVFCAIEIIGCIWLLIECLTK